MAKKNNLVNFRLIEIKTDQFAIFEENYNENEEVNLETNLTFGLNKDENIFLVTAKYIFEIKEKPFLTVQTTCFFKIEDDAVASFKIENKIAFPKGFVAHMSMLTVGTTRGILHGKTEGTLFNRFILPTIDVATMIPEDVTFD